MSARFNLLVTGGEILDPAAGLTGRLDLGSREGRIAAVAPALPGHAASEVVEATGLTVVPGLVDLRAVLGPADLAPPPLVAPDACR
jgi:dihydroorotase